MDTLSTGTRLGKEGGASLGLRKDDETATVPHHKAGRIKSWILDIPPLRDGGTQIGLHVTDLASRCD
jgi:hypothetical protein